MKTRMRLIPLFALIPFFSLAQSMEDGKKALEMQQYEKAKRIFNGLIKKDSHSSESFYYLGTALLESSKVDSAKWAFDQAIAANPKTSFGYLGLAAIALNSNKQDEAKANFEKAIAAEPKNANVYVNAAEVILNSDYTDAVKAREYLKKALELDKVNAKANLLMGDVYLSKNSGGEALSSYERAAEINKNYPLAYLKMGELYIRARNYEEAKNNFKKVLEIDSLYAPAFRDLGETYFHMRQYDKAKDQYKKFVSLTENNVNAQIRYAQFLFLSNDHKAAAEEINSILKKDTTNNVIYRLLAYSDYETGKYDEGLKALDNFFAKAAPKKILASDYEYYAKLLLKKGQDSLAMEKMQKAVAMDSLNPEIHNTMAEMYTNNKKYKEAAAEYKAKMRLNRKTSVQDTYKLGMSLYYAGDYAQADSMFAKVTELSPSYQGGYLWRARANAMLDPDSKQGLAKPYYEKFIELAQTDPAKYKSDLITAYKYLGYYYFLQKDNATSKTFWLKVKELDPNDKQTNDVLKSLK